MAEQQTINQEEVQEHKPYVKKEGLTEKPVLQTLNSAEEIGKYNFPFSKEDIIEYKQLKDEASKIEKRLKELAPKIKESLIQTSVGNMVYGGKNVSLTFQDKSTMDEDKLIAVLQRKGLQDAIDVKYVPNPDKLKMLMQEGLLTVDDMTECTIPNYIPVLKISDPKKSKTANPFI